MESNNRFLTTHTGSLPRPDDLVSIMYAKEEGQNIDHAELGERIHAAVAEVVAKQRKAGPGRGLSESNWPSGVPTPLSETTSLQLVSAAS
jgi:hypothetical protein